MVHFYANFDLHQYISWCSQNWTRQIRNQIVSKLTKVFCPLSFPSSSRRSGEVSVFSLHHCHYVLENCVQHRFHRPLCYSPTFKAVVYSGEVLTKQIINLVVFRFWLLLIIESSRGKGK